MQVIILQWPHNRSGGMCLSNPMEWNYIDIEPVINYNAKIGVSRLIMDLDLARSIQRPSKPLRTMFGENL